MASFQTLLAGPPGLLRDGIKKILSELPDLEVVGEVSDAQALFDSLEELSPCLLILDTSLSNFGGIEVVRELKSSFHDTKVLLLTTASNQVYLCHAMSAGVEGYLLKEDPASELLTAVTTILNGSSHISRRLAEHLTDKILVICRKKRRLPLRLTPQELEVLRLVLQGKTSKEVAEVLFISVRTVEHHRANIMRKLDVKSFQDLIRYAFQEGYVA